MMSKKIDETAKMQVFISSNQKELEPERLALFGLITTDPFLKDYFEPILFEKLPPPSRPTEKPYLKVLETCQAYILMLDREYGVMDGKYSATHSKMASVFRVRGLVWQDGESGDFHPTAGGVVFLGRNPALRFPQCQVLGDAYRDTKATSTPFAQSRFSGPIPRLIEDLLAFVYKNTAHPTRIVGINNIELDEYPVKAVREALVNAFAIAVTKMQDVRLGLRFSETGL